MGRKTYTKEYKESAVELFHKSGKSAKEIADELGIHQENLCRWFREAKNIRVFPGQGSPRDEELARLKRENADLRGTVEILKKATAIFAKKNQ